jgi:transcriptional regulator with XRE-family HTH domain
MKNLATEIGARIKSKRESQKITQKKLAEKVGISAAAINKFEKGEKKPSTPVLLKIAEVLYTTTDYLLLGDKEDEVSVAFRGFSKLSTSDKDIVRNLLSSLQERNKEENN